MANAADGALHKIKAILKRTSLEHANDVLELVSFCESTEPVVVMAAMKATVAVFLQLHAQPRIVDKVLTWLQQQRVKFEQILLKNLEGPSTDVQLLSFGILMEIVKNHFVVNPELIVSPFQSGVFPMVIAKMLSLKSGIPSPWVDAFKQNFLGFEDVLFFTLEQIRKCVSKFQLEDKTKQNQVCEHGDAVFCENVLELLKTISSHVAKHSQNSQQFKKFVNELRVNRENSSEEGEANDEGKESGKKRKASSDLSGPAKRRKTSPTSSLITPPAISASAMRKNFQGTWLAFLQMKRVVLTAGFFQQVFQELPKNIIPNMEDPVILIDFLTESFDRNRAAGKLGNSSSSKTAGSPNVAENFFIALQSLKGLFILITQHNLEYPQFYPKLYDMLDMVFDVLNPPPFQTQPTKKTKANTTNNNGDESEQQKFKILRKFFKLLEQFLKSPMLPTYMVSGFIKKLTRMALLSPPSLSIIVLPFVRNLFLGHPTTVSLLHHTSSSESSASKVPSVLKLSNDNESLVAVDPFVSNASLADANATLSSLWELQVLMNHYHTGSISGGEGQGEGAAGGLGVASGARLLRNKISNKSASTPLPQKPLFDHEMKRKVKEGIPMAFVTPPLPQGLSSSESEKAPVQSVVPSSNFFPGWSF